VPFLSRPAEDRPREVPDVNGEQLGVQQQCRGRDEIVGVVDAAEGTPVLQGQSAGRPGDGLVDRLPSDGPEEGFGGVTLAVPHPGKQLEPDNFAGHQLFAVLDQLVKETRRRWRPP
jgi:hypothetical protein